MPQGRTQMFKGLNSNCQSNLTKFEFNVHNSIQSLLVGKKIFNVLTFPNKLPPRCHFLFLVQSSKPHLIFKKQIIFGPSTFCLSYPIQFGTVDSHSML